MPDFTVGVEEEFFLVDAETRELLPGSAAVLEAAPTRRDDQLEPELRRSPVLVERSEWAEVVSTCQRLLREGNGAERQRRAFERRGSLADVVDMLVEATSA